MIGNFAWRTGRNCVFKNFIHLVFVTKYLRNVFTQEMLADMKAIFAETCTQMDGELLKFEGIIGNMYIKIAKQAVYLCMVF